jgi:hypothetical protein
MRPSFDNEFWGKRVISIVNCTLHLVVPLQEKNRHIAAGIASIATLNKFILSVASAPFNSLVICKLGQSRSELSHKMSSSGPWSTFVIQHISNVDSQMFYNAKDTHPKLSLPRIDCKQERQCTYDSKLRRVHVSIVAWKGNEYYIFWVCL